MEKNATIEIKPYEPWMKPQIVALFSKQYGVPENIFSDYFDKFYEHPYQAKKAIRLAAVEGDKVAGFQTFFYWPYFFNGKKLNSYQSGNSLVSPQFRGKGIFQKLLGAFDDYKERYEVEFLAGFPVEQSFPSFMKNGWKNVLNLKWYVRVINPFSRFFKQDLKKAGKVFDRTPEYFEPVSSNDSFRLTKEIEFQQWREQFSFQNKYYYFHYREKEKTVRFDLKFNTRGKMTELIIGDVIYNSDDFSFLSRAFTGLIRQAYQLKFLTFISITLNKEHHDNLLLRILRKKLFFRIKKEIHFIVKECRKNDGILSPSRWQLFRSDIDTW